MKIEKQTKEKYIARSEWRHCVKQFGTTYGVLKPLSEISDPDLRFRIMVISNEEEMRAFDVSDIHERLSDIALTDGIPEDVRTAFETARNLLLYTWFVFEFQTVAEMQAYGALELALRKKLGATLPAKPQPKFARLLQAALDQGLFESAQAICYERMLSKRPFYQRFESKEQKGVTATPTLPSPKDWFGAVVKSMPEERNHIAHGNPKLYLSGAFDCLELCATLINSLYPKLAV